MCILEHVFVYVCVWLVAFPVLAMKRRTLAEIALWLYCVWKGRTVPGQCQLPPSSDVLML